MSFRSPQSAVLKTDYIVLGLSLIFGIYLRAQWIGADIDYDEAYTWLFYSQEPWLKVISQYNLPNNHILNSLLVKLSSLLFSSHEPWVLRAPSFILGLLSLFLVYPTTKLLAGPRVAIYATAVFCVSHGIIYYSSQARGYGQQIFWIFLWIYLVQRQKKDLGIVLAGSLMLWTVPIGIYPLLTLFIFLFLSSDLRSRFWRLGFKTIFLTTLLYLPALVFVLLSGTTVATNEVRLNSFSGGIEYIESIFEFWSPNFGSYFLIGFLIALPFVVIQRHNKLVGRLALSLILSVCILIGFTGVIPAYSRVWLWAFPIAVLVLLSFLLKPKSLIGSLLSAGVVISLAWSSYSSWIKFKTSPGNSVREAFDELRKNIAPGEYFVVPQIYLTQFEYLETLQKNPNKNFPRYFIIDGDWHYAMVRTWAEANVLRTELPNPRVYALKGPDEWKDLTRKYTEKRLGLRNYFFQDNRLKHWNVQ